MGWDRTFCPQPLMQTSAVGLDSMRSVSPGVRKVGDPDGRPWVPLVSQQSRANMELVGGCQLGVSGPGHPGVGRNGGRESLGNEGAGSLRGPSL